MEKLRGLIRLGAIVLAGALVMLFVSFPVVASTGGGVDPVGVTTMSSGVVRILASHRPVLEWAIKEQKKQSKQRRDTRIRRGWKGLAFVSKQIDRYKTKWGVTPAGRRFRQTYRCRGAGCGD